MAFGIGGGMRPAVGGGEDGGRSRMGPSVGPDMNRGFDSFKRGGKVKKTGLAKVEKGEKVLTKKQQHERSAKKMGKR